MKIYLISLGAGVLVGIFYGAIGVRSPAPPIVALVGLLGMLVGEQVVPVAKRMMAGTPPVAAWQESQCTEHVFGRLPGDRSEQAPAVREEAPS